MGWELKEYGTEYLRNREKSRERNLKWNWVGTESENREQDENKEGARKRIYDSWCVVETRKTEDSRSVDTLTSKKSHDLLISAAAVTK
ncbi:hypothetical protein EVAR_31024_1 [Eumeta japonica]|uniref:Uncharacterized protein n=1 Tax=Eumeta variegata TaxID=151549 RepID=A0A4C1VDX8_EUMVA|nr:hypothetical protein EVAR_31024_1 [Eumeta japonica]